jgi:signal transduction histidine kinase
MQVLVVDDIPANRKLLRVQLEGEGHSVFEAADGIEALESLAHEKVDVIISDILMPRMDGYRLCHEVRNNDRLRNLPFIICSSTYTSEADAKLAMEVGADRYFKKPAATREITAALEEFRSMAKSGRPREASLPEEGFVMKEYSEALVRKLEEKNSELERTQAELLRLNQCLEQRIEERTVDLREANAELDAFNRSVTHDLRTPLTEVYAYSQLLQGNKAGPLTEPVRDFVGKILAAATRMESLIKQLMKLSLIKQGDLRRAEFRLNTAAAGAIARLREQEPGRQVEFVIAPDLVVNADVQLVHIALENLINNAWKYSAKNPQARIELGQVIWNNERVFFVRDNGVGFDMQQAGRLFRPFERLHSPGEFPGTGVGLSIVERIVTRHGGRIWAESKPGTGATFYFTLSQ